MIEVRGKGLTKGKAVETEDNERIQEISRNNDLETYRMQDEGEREAQNDCQMVLAQEIGRMVFTKIKNVPHNAIHR